MPFAAHSSIEVAVAAMKHGYQPVPILAGEKRPYGSGWTHLRWNSEEAVRASFGKWVDEGATNLGLLLGEPSRGLVDVDLDHPKTLRLRDYFLPPSPMQSGRVGRPRSHRWYLSTGEIPSTRRYKMPDGSVSVELRSTGSQTVIPPSIHPSGEAYRWEGGPFGGQAGPAEVDGRTLSIQVALLGMGAVLLDNWPKQGGRHDAYLALAGGLLRYGEKGIHPYWERNLGIVIGAMADATNDEDGADARISEVLSTTIQKLRQDGKAVGFPRLAEIIGVDHAEQVRRMAKEVESLAGFIGTPKIETQPDRVPGQGTLPLEGDAGQDGPLPSTLPPEIRNPMEERLTSWSAVDLEPYLLGEVSQAEATVLVRDDGQGLMYAGRLNVLFGLSESAKSWVAMYAGVQEIAKGGRVLYLDFEDEPIGIINRFRVLGAGDDDLKNQLRYVHPEDPLADMQRYRFGASPTADGERNASALKDLLASFDPTLVIADGLNELYGLHGHDTNDATGSTIVASWLKKLTRGTRTTVIVIDHTGKGGDVNASPIGAHHKVAMVQGTALHVVVIDRPMRGAKGAVKLVVHKDRLSSVRMISTKQSQQVAGIVEIDSTVDGVTRMQIVAPDPNDAVIADTPAQRAKMESLEKSERLQKLIIKMYEGDLSRELKTDDVMEATNSTREEVYDAWQMLQVRSIVKRIGVSRYTRYVLNGDLPDFSPEEDGDDE